MIGLISLASCSLVLLQGFVSGSPVPGAAVPHYFKRNPTTPVNLSLNTLQRELGSILSNGTLIFGANSSDWENATTRWNLYAIPDVKVVVRPAAESDISKIVSVECNSWLKGAGVTGQPLFLVG